MRLLQTFVTVAKVKHFGHTAQILHCTQSGVSQQLARLERQLGFALLNRGAGPVELTAAGAVFLVHAERVLALVRRMEEESRLVAEGRGGPLTVGLSSAAVHSRILARVTAFKRTHPDVRLSVVVHSGHELLDMLHRGELDMLITTLPAPDGDYTRRAIEVQPMGLAVPADHPLSVRRSVAFADFADERFIVVPRDHHASAYDGLITLFHERGKTLRVAAHEVSFPSLQARVALGEGLGFLPTGLPTIAGVTIVPLDPSTRLPPLEVLLIIPTDREVAAAHRFAAWWTTENGEPC